MTSPVISLIGGESTGKSHLAAALAQRWDAAIAEDQTRAFVNAHQRTPLLEDQAALFARQADAITDALRTTAPVVIADPDPFMTAVYSLVYFNNDELTSAGLASLTAARVVVWCRPDIPWEADGMMRDGETVRAATDAVIATLLRQTSATVIETSNERTTHPGWVPDLGAFLP